MTDPRFAIRRSDGQWYIGTADHNALFSVNEAATYSTAEGAEERLQEYGPVYCLGTTKGGQPKHPLYLPKDTELEEWA